MLRSRIIKLNDNGKNTDIIVYTQKDDKLILEKFDLKNMKILTLIEIDNVSSMFPELLTDNFIDFTKLNFLISKIGKGTLNV